MAALKDNLRRRSAEDRRDERDDLGFLRQPPVRWLSPPLLVKAGVEVLVSSTFGKLTDKRELQSGPCEPFDHAGKDEVWLDFLSDTGDGWEATSTMAWLLAQPKLVVGQQELPRGEALLLGGDQVYPTADPEAYEDRFVGPFAGALPWSEDPETAPRMYVTPGNHDWYDGLTSFLRLFCRAHWIGGWRTCQRRSYYALKLPHNWWAWAIDIQLDTYIDDPQLDYFKSLELAPGAKIILLTAKPSWVKAHDERVEPASWRYLAYFEEHVVRKQGARLALTLTGDLHHYSRYEPQGPSAASSPTRITAGGGGAYLSCTHTLRENVKVRPWLDVTPVEYVREEIYPREDESKKLSWGILRLARLNPGFSLLLGVIYTLTALAMLAAVNGGPEPLLEQVTGNDVAGFLERVAGGAPLLVALLLTAALIGYTDVTPSPLAVRRRVRWPVIALRILFGAAQAALHLVLIGTLVWFALKWASEPVHAWLLAAPLALGVGAVGGTTVFAAFLLMIHRFFGWRADRAANEVFAGQGLTGYKHFIRMRLDAEGLELFPIGVEEVCEKWDHSHTAHGPKFEPQQGHTPHLELIDGPVRIEP